MIARTSHQLIQLYRFARALVISFAIYNLSKRYVLLVYFMYVHALCFFYLHHYTN